MVNAANPSDSDVYASDSSLEPCVLPGKDASPPMRKKEISPGNTTQRFAPNGFGEDQAKEKKNDRIRKSSRDGPDIQEAYWVVLRGRICGVFSNEADAKSSTSSSVRGVCLSAASKNEAFATWDRAYAEGRVGVPNSTLRAIPVNHSRLQVSLDAAWSPTPSKPDQPLSRPRYSPSKTVRLSMKTQVSQSEASGLPTPTLPGKLCSLSPQALTPSACSSAPSPPSNKSGTSQPLASATTSAQASAPATPDPAARGRIKSPPRIFSRARKTGLRRWSYRSNQRRRKMTEAGEPRSFWYVVQSYPINVFTSYTIARSASAEQGSDVLVFDNEYQAEAVRGELEELYDQYAGWDDEDELE